MMTIHVESIIKVLVAVIIGGVIGFDRESIRRPAGLRTHILVCVASAVVIDMNIRLVENYIHADPVRLGAQVISGMGFLGAGTIIKEGATVKGLTTAASLWAVACMGLVTGAGFYSLALFATLVMVITLKFLNAFERRYHKKREK